MLPKNSKHYIIPTAEQVDLKPQLVEDAIDFYYKTLRTALIDLKSHNIQIENLGLFKVKPKEVSKLVIKYNKHLGVLTKDTFLQMKLRKDITQKLEKAVAVQTKLREDKTRKIEFFKKKRNGEFEKNRES